MTERHETYPNGLEAVCLITVLFFVELLIGGVVQDAGLFASVAPGDLDGLITIAGNGVLFCALLAYKRINYAGLFHPARHSVLATLGTLSLPVIMLVPGLVVGIGAINIVLLSLFPMTPSEEAMFEQMMTGGVIAALFGCIAAPVLEEMLFRGIILRSFLRQYSRRSAILGSAALFGFAHLNVYQLATGFVIGVIAGWLYERARSLWPCIVLHAAYNSAVTYVATTGAAQTDMWVAAPISALAFALVGAFLLRRLLAKQPVAEAPRKPGMESDEEL
jgi:membrane protease YdiL (CAAX protease family)